VSWHMKNLCCDSHHAFTSHIVVMFTSCGHMVRKYIACFSARCFILVASRPRHIVSAAPSCPGTLHVSYIFSRVYTNASPFIMSPVLVSCPVIAGTCSVHVLGGPSVEDSLHFITLTTSPAPRCRVDGLHQSTVHTCIKLWFIQISTQGGGLDRLYQPENPKHLRRNPTHPRGPSRGFKSEPSFIVQGDLLGPISGAAVPRSWSRKMSCSRVTWAPPGSGSGPVPPTLLEPAKCHVHDFCDCCRPRPAPD
jgi:hypothetical protein